MQPHLTDESTTNVCGMVVHDEDSKVLARADMFYEANHFRHSDVVSQPLSLNAPIDPSGTSFTRVRGPSISSHLRSQRRRHTVPVGSDANDDGC